MVKKILIVFLAIIIQNFYCFAYAKTVKVTALTDYNSKKPPYSFKVRLDEPIFLSDNKIIYTDYILNGYIYKNIPPKRLKQDANFIFIPTSYTDTNNVSTGVDNIVATRATTINKTELVVSSALVFTIGLIPALIATTGFFAAEGALQDKSGDKLSSSVNSAYEKSYLSIGKKGNELFIKKNQEFLLNIAIIKEQAPNYSFSPAK